MKDALYYHIKASGTGTSIKFFNVSEGADGEAVTNIPDTNKLARDFMVNAIKVRFSQDLTQADALKLAETAIIALTIDKEEIVKMPLIECMSNVRIEAAMTETAGDLWQLFKPTDGYEFKNPITIPAKTYFSLEITLEAGLGADTDVVCSLIGEEK